MFSDASLPEPKIILEIEPTPRLVEISLADGIFFCEEFSSDKRVRSYIYNLLLQAQKALPSGIFFQVYEAYRPLQAQVKLWNEVVAEQTRLHPEMDVESEEFVALCDRYCANPHRQGSGHQSGAALDISLCDKTGQALDMGCPVRHFGPKADFEAPVSAEARANRELLRRTLEGVGFVNYPSEWWHYSFGDRLWARLTGSRVAVFSRLDV